MSDRKDDDRYPKPTYAYRPDPQNNRVSEFPFFVKHPSRDVSPEREIKENPYFVSAANLDPKTWLTMMCQYDCFKKTGNPIYLIEAFLVAHKENLYPPFWVMDYIAKVFEEYHNSQGLKDLNKLFGLNKGKGRSPIFKSLIEEERDSILCFEVYRLQTLLECSVEEASYMVARRLEETKNFNKSPFKINKIGEETIKDKYNKKWKKIYDRDLFRNAILSWSKEKREEYIKQFPEDSYPIK